MDGISAHKPLNLFNVWQSLMIQLTEGDSTYEELKLEDLVGSIIAHVEEEQKQSFLPPKRRKTAHPSPEENVDNCRHDGRQEEEDEEEDDEGGWKGGAAAAGGRRGESGQHVKRPRFWTDEDWAKLEWFQDQDRAVSGLADIPWSLSGLFGEKDGRGPRNPKDP